MKWFGGVANGVVEWSSALEGVVEKHQIWDGKAPNLESFLRKILHEKTLCLFSNDSFRYSVLASLEPCRCSSTRKNLLKKRSIRTFVFPGLLHELLEEARIFP